MIEQIQQYYQQFQELVGSSLFQDYGAIGLLINSILSATALPIPTEPLTASLLSGGESKLVVALVLIIGSVIGGIMNYWLGFGGKKLSQKIRHKLVSVQPNIDEKQQGKVERLLTKFGWIAIFFAPFILVIGDLILITAGVKRLNFTRFLIVMISGKIFKAVAVVFGLGLVFS